MNRLTDILTLEALKVEDIYSKVVAYNNQTEAWNIKNPSEVLECEDCLPIVESEHGLRNSIYACTEGLKALSFVSVSKIVDIHRIP